MISVTRLGDLLHFGQLFKACVNNYFAQIAHIVRQFFKGVKIFHFSSEIILGNFFRHLATFYWSHCVTGHWSTTTNLPISRRDGGGGLLSNVALLDPVPHGVGLIVDGARAEDAPIFLEHCFD